ncbi:MAG: HAD family hydrolase [Acidimicrobiales bacterium]
MTIDAVMFDMGGVLVELGPLTDLIGDAPLDADEFWQRWLTSRAVRDFERGRVDAATFAAAVVDDLGLSVSAEVFLERFEAWPRGFFAGAEALVREVAQRCVTGVVSNTNSRHWHHQRDGAAMRALFERRFLSFELDLIKPDEDYFEYLLADLALAPESVLFLDDNQLNVDGARAMGLRAEVVRGPAQARVAVEVHGVL